MNRKKVLFNSFTYILSLFLILSSIPFYGTKEVSAQEDDGTSVSGEIDTSENKQLHNTDSNSSATLKEIPDLRNANSKVFLNEDGSYIAEVYLEQIHYKENNQWIDIDNTLVSSGDNQSLKNTDNQFEVNFPKKPFQQDETELFTYETKGHEMQIDLVTNDSDTSTTEEPKEIIPTVNENQIVLKEPLNDVTFEYIVEGSKVKENIILDSYQGKNSFAFDLNVKNLEAKKQTDGSIHFLDQKGNFVFLIERPYMYDSSTTNGPEGEISQNVEQEIVKTENGYLLTITADEAFLTDPKRVYPVTIDPWIDVNQAEDTFVASSSTSNYHNTDYLSVGYNSTLGKTRSLLKFNLPTIPNGEVSDAKLLLNQITDSSATQVDVHQVTAPFSTTTVTWANQPKYKLEPSGKNQNSAKGEAAFSVTDTVKEWYESPSTNYGLLLKFPDSIEGSTLRKTYYSSESTNSLSTKPSLKVTYKPIELLGLTDYWTYTPDNFQGEGAAVVNVINGNMVYDISLLNLPGKTDAFNLALTYNSLSYYNYHYGFSWMFNAHESILTNADNSIVEYRSEGGGRYHFTKLEDGSYRSPEGYEGYEMTRTTNGFELKDTNETVRYFDNLGRNYEIKDENGNRIVYTFENSSSSRVTKITELTGTTETGRSIALGYTNGYLASVTDFNGNITSLLYDTVAGRNVLENIIYAKGSSTEKTIEFSYDPNTARLIAVKDGNGNIGKIEYDPFTQQVTKLIDPRSDEIFSSLEYGDGYTIYIDSNGNKTRYVYSSSESKDTTNVTEVTENYETNLATTWKYVWEKNRIVSTTEPDQMTGLTPNTPTTTAEYNEDGELLTLNTTGNQSVALDRTDEKNNVIATNDSSLVENHFTYDAFSNLISTSNNMVLTDYNQYDKYGNITQSASPTSGNYNRLQNSQFEKLDTTYPTGWSRYIGTGAGTHQSSTNSYIMP
ncbi:DNRLRE domain-containing protein (plasmid) [Ureibacillus chungkukjangi]|uniref:DNRLRE domain-containing protein n=1 Tax=Ureibacillus chungkukjangi TaxID=1202712 RepID=UPI000D353BE4|nr:DNRLRE domain-containing protein [Ureibacillus chungkukjangi]